MMKKKVVLILCIILGLLIMGCSNNSNEIKTNVDDNEITILVEKDDFVYDITWKYFKIYGYAERFELETGIKVNFDVINGNNEDDYEKKMNTKLYLNEGPTLIFISDDSTYKKYIERGIAVDTQGKIPNLTKVYDSLLTDGGYFIPVGMIHYPVILHRREFNKLKIDDPNLIGLKKTI